MHQQSTRVRTAYLYLAPVVWGVLVAVMTTGATVDHWGLGLAVALGMAGGLGLGLNHNRPIT